MKKIGGVGGAWRTSDVAKKPSKLSETMELPPDVCFCQVFGGRIEDWGYP